MEYLKALVDYGILGILIFMSFLSLWFFIERLIFYKNIVPKEYENKKELEIALTNNLTTIGTIASNAPYIGLLGTVLAIMLTFYTMAQRGMVASKVVMALALALKATAAGLVVAIISMIFYNILLRNVEKIIIFTPQKTICFY